MNLASLTPAQMRCLPLLVIGLSANKVAEKANVSATKISQWKSDPIFMEALELSRRDAVSDAQKAFKGLSLKAIEILSETLDSGSEANRLKASIYILDKIELAESAYSIKGDVNINEVLSALGV